MSGPDRRSILKLAAASAPLAIGACATAGTGGAPAQGDQASLLIDLDRGPDLEIDLWRGSPPGNDALKLDEHYVFRDNPFGLMDRAAHNVMRPTLSLFRAARPNGSAILIAPGGGYRWVVVEKEGFEGARWFNQSGAHVYVLKYRLPHQGWLGGPDTPLQDAQRAMRLIRSRATEDGVDPARVTVMGFSAGGHVAGSLTQRFDAPVYGFTDAVDRLPARPDAAVLVYPVATMRPPFVHQGSRDCLIGASPDEAHVAKYSLETKPPADTPPTFILHAGDDEAVPVENAVNLYSALRASGVATSMHVFETGGHGFGLRGIDRSLLRAWPTLVRDWIAATLTA